jgi:hypothetical protein
VIVAFRNFAKLPMTLAKRRHSPNVQIDRGRWANAHCTSDCLNTEQHATHSADGSVGGGRGDMYIAYTRGFSPRLKKCHSKCPRYVKPRLKRKCFTLDGKQLACLLRNMSYNDLIRMLSTLPVLHFKVCTLRHHRSHIRMSGT